MSEGLKKGAPIRHPRAIGVIQVLPGDPVFPQAGWYWREKDLGTLDPFVWDGPHGTEEEARKDGAAAAESSAPPRANQKLMPDGLVGQGRKSLRQRQAETIFRQARECGISCETCVFHGSHCSTSLDYLCSEWGEK